MEEQGVGTVCGVGDRQDGDVCAGKENAISAQKINNSTPCCVCKTLNV